MELILAGEPTDHFLIPQEPSKGYAVVAIHERFSGWI
jgi:hypothetical protein